MCKHGLPNSLIILTTYLKHAAHIQGPLLSISKTNVVESFEGSGKRKSKNSRKSDLAIICIKGFLSRFWLFAGSFLLLLERAKENITLNDKTIARYNWKTLTVTITLLKMQIKFSWYYRVISRKNKK